MHSLLSALQIAGCIRWLARIKRSGHTQPQMNCFSGKYGMAGGVLCVLLAQGFFACTSPLYHFKVTSTYISDDFSGHTLEGRTFCVSSLLTKEGPVDSGRFPLPVLIDTIRHRRSDLNFSALDGTHKAFYSVISEPDRAGFFSMLFNGKMLTSARFDTVWQAVASDYLMVFNLRQGMSINTFDRVSQKTMRIEAELWDCSSYEVVWRAEVDGSSYRKDLSDRTFLCAGIGDVVSTLPAVLPSYEKSAW